MNGPRTADPPIARTRERQVYRNRFVTVYDDDVRFANGTAGRYFRIVYGDGHPGVVVMPVAGEYTALVRTWRYAQQGWEWAFPRGYAHGPDPEVTARAELIEETGTEPLELIPLGRVHPESAHTESAVHMYAGRVSLDAAGPEQPGPVDVDEVAEVRWITRRELGQLIVRGVITDGFTLAVMGAWAAWQEETRDGS